MEKMALGKTIDKINTNHAKLIMRKIDDRPYYEIEYFDPKDNQYYVGYGSYTKEYVEEWLDIYFNIIK